MASFIFCSLSSQSYISLPLIIYLFLLVPSQEALSLYNWHPAPPTGPQLWAFIFWYKDRVILCFVYTAPANDGLHFIRLCCNYTFTIYCHQLLLELSQSDAWIFKSVSLLWSTFPIAITFPCSYRNTFDLKKNVQNLEKSGSLTS